MERKHLSEPYFSYVKIGLKTVEGRLFKDYWSTLSIGDKIEFYNLDESIKVEVTNIILVNSFEKLYEIYGDQLIPVSTKDKVISLYDKIYGDQQNKYKVVGIEMKLL